jgi:hypothetical protein
MEYRECTGDDCTDMEHKVGCILFGEPVYEFDAFEVALVAEFPDPSGGTFCERVNGLDEDWMEETLGTFWTVYGHLTTGGAQAIADFPAYNDARNLADALAYGRPVYEV